MADLTRISVRDPRYHNDRAHGLLVVRTDGAPPVMQHIRDWHPAFSEASDEHIRTSPFGIDDARLVYAREHGHATWQDFMTHLASIDASASGEPFLAVCEAGARGDWSRALDLVKEYPEALRARGTNGNSLLNLASAMVPGPTPGSTADSASEDAARSMVRLAPVLRLLHAGAQEGADLHCANDRGWTPLHQAAYRNDRALAEVLISHGAPVDGSAHGDGGTPLAVALFWGHIEAASLLAQHGVRPRNLRVAAALGRVDDMRLLLEDPAFRRFAAADAGTLPEAMRHRAFYRPHSGFPAWTPRADRQEVLDEALAWAARCGAAEAMPLLLRHGADVHADSYRGTALAWAAWNGRVPAARWLIDHGADVNQRGTFGGLSHGVGVTATHLAAQRNQVDMLQLLVAAGANLSVRDAQYSATPRGWAEHDGQWEAAAFLARHERAS